MKNKKADEIPPLFEGVDTIQTKVLDSKNWPIHPTASVRVNHPTNSQNKVSIKYKGIVKEVVRETSGTHINRILIVVASKSSKHFTLPEYCTVIRRKRR